MTPGTMKTEQLKYQVDYLVPGTVHTTHNHNAIVYTAAVHSKAKAQRMLYSSRIMRGGLACWHNNASMLISTATQHTHTHKRRNKDCNLKFPAATRTAASICWLRAPITHLQPEITPDINTTTSRQAITSTNLYSSSGLA